MVCVSYRADYKMSIPVPGTCKNNQLWKAAQKVWFQPDAGEQMQHVQREDLVEITLDLIRISAEELSRTRRMKDFGASRIYTVSGYPTVPHSGCENTSYPHYGIAWLCKCSLPQQNSFHSNLYIAQVHKNTHAKWTVCALLKYMYIHFICRENCNHRESRKGWIKEEQWKELPFGVEASRSRIDRPTLIMVTSWTAFKYTATWTVSCVKGHQCKSTFTQKTGVLWNIRTLGMD